MKTLTENQVRDLAYSNGLQIDNEDTYFSSCDYILSYKEFLKETSMRDSKKAFQSYADSLPPVEKA